MTKLHSKEISFGGLSQDIQSIQQLSKESGTLLKRKELWEGVNTEISKILQESQDRQESRISKKREKLEEDLSVYDELIDECGADEEHQLLQDIDEKLIQLDDLKSTVTVSPEKLEARILCMIEQQTQQNISETIKLPRLPLETIREISGLSVEERGVDLKMNNGISLGTILSICDIKEDKISATGFEWIVVCRQIAQILSSQDAYTSFMQETNYGSHSPVHDTRYNSFAHGTKVAV